MTRTGLDWHRYKATIGALAALPVKSAYIDGQLCAPDGQGISSFSRLQAAMDQGHTEELIFFAFDLLFLQGRSTETLPLIERKKRLKLLFSKNVPSLRFSDHVVGDGPSFLKHACEMSLEGVISKRVDRPYAPGDRGLWVKSKCLNREEFIVVGWTDPAGSRGHIGALILGYYTPDGRLLYAGRAGTGMKAVELKRLNGILKPLGIPRTPLDEPPPRESRFGSPLQLSRVHWLRPEVVVEVTYLTWTEDGLLRQVSYQGQREDKPAREVIRAAPVTRN
ncbi:non-homologous end-joining DNA ligase [Reyranella sp.]|uniref:non-homologous end-joining DNA ligase n=1 Tax=Reyranella sp. TaxID=1929291 RepID=UPI002F95968C